MPPWLEPGVPRGARREGPKRAGSPRYGVLYRVFSGREATPRAWSVGQGAREAGQNERSVTHGHASGAGKVTSASADRTRRNPEFRLDAEAAADGRPDASERARAAFDAPRDLGPALRLLRAAGLPQLRLGTGVLRGRNVMSLARPLPGALLWFPRRLTAASLSDVPILARVDVGPNAAGRYADAGRLCPPRIW